LNKIIEKLKEHSPFAFADFLDSELEDKELDNARKQIREMLQYCFFPIIAFIFLIIYCEGLKITEQEGTGFILFGFVAVFLIWAFIVNYYVKKRELKKAQQKLQ
jgi:hypothetical protein